MESAEEMEIASASNHNGSGKRAYEHTTPAQRIAMLYWLEHPSNFALITGSAVVHERTSAGRRKLRKSDAFAKLASHVNKFTTANWSDKVAKSRYESFISSYKKTKRVSLEPDFGVSRVDIQRGITTVPEKLEALCPLFERLDMLFEGAESRENHVTNPPSVLFGDPPSDSDDAVTITTTVGVPPPREDHSSGLTVHTRSQQLTSQASELPRRRCHAQRQTRTAHYNAPHEESKSDEPPLPEPSLAGPVSSESIVLSTNPQEPEKPVCRSRDLSPPVYIRENLEAKFQLQREQLEFEKQKAADQLELEREKLLFQEKSEREKLQMQEKLSKGELIRALVSEKKSVAEIKEYLALFE